MFNLGYPGRNVDLCLIHFRVIEKFGGFDWYVAQCHGMLASGQHGVARLSRPAPSNLLFFQGKPSKTMVDCLATFVEEMQFQIKLILKIPRGHETLHNLVDEALLLKEARSWSHANLPYANVFGSFKIRPCCIDQIKQNS
nr:uncharacterized protein LOC107276744 isoform X1 [Oryza sativa Japonica Group]XP_025879231.1 uncharacterized protein LOC107276744 isoform X1 [Oryza sativa Japonica Group]XP_025879232.1 uncharacterized protein LOC107276744 isoform X1 [Oryza sativa Japonica Group]